MEIKGMPTAEAAPAKMFDGRFFISNPYEFDHTCRWNGTEYMFKAGTTSPLVIMDANPIETQNIRKMFAEEIGTAAYFKSKGFKELAATEKATKGMGVPTFVPARKSDGSFNPDSPVAPFIQRCLEPLPIVPATETKRAKSKSQPKTDEHGRQVIKVLDHTAQGNYSFESEALNASE